MADWSAKMAKIEEASRKKDEMDQLFKTHAKELLDTKMEQYEEKREQQITEIKEKLKNTDKLNEVRATVDLLESQKSEEKTRIIENKLSTAEQNREKEIQKKLDLIRKHERRAEIVRQNKAALATQKNDDNSVTASSG
ncbi:hypothetical protein RP20_CCG011087 [Aedes albopictus]|nr:hypothetical protein RP20_CCG011087 [Aedes albopictus]